MLEPRLLLSGTALELPPVDLSSSPDPVITAPPAGDWDYGDAPSPYPTMYAQNGARHALGGPVFGYKSWHADPDGDGQPSADATGDDLNVPEFYTEDDEEGVRFTGGTIVPGPAQEVTIDVYGASPRAYVNAWIDFNRDGDWADAGEQIFDDKIVFSGSDQVLTFVVPDSAVSGTSFARFRISTTTGLSYMGQAANGEVEDHVVEIKNFVDYGDAPSPYPTLRAANGARHQFTEDGSLLFGYMDWHIDAEPDGQPNDTATGDDLNNPSGADDDEQGVWVPSPGTLHSGTTGQVTMQVHNVGLDAFVNAWIDYNQDGDWADDGEQIFTDLPVVNGLQTVDIDVPITAMGGMTFARFRLNSSGGLSYTGYAADGEVEDHQIQIVQPVSAATGAPDLQDGSDTGSSNSDNITARDNSQASRTLEFTVTGTIVGATVTIYADAVAVGSATATGATTVVTTSGAQDLADKTYAITARQREPYKAESDDSDPLDVTVDTTGPSATDFGVLNSHPDWSVMGTMYSSLLQTGRSGQTASWSVLDQVAVVFDEPVLAAQDDLGLFGVDSGVMAPTAVKGLGTDEIIWTVTQAGAFLATDSYALDVDAGVTDLAGNTMAAGWSADLNVAIGDINGDGRASSRDRRELRNAYGSVLGGPGYDVFADLNGDTRVSSRDRRTLRDYYGTSLPSLSAPLAAPGASADGDEDLSGSAGRAMAQAAATGTLQAPQAELPAPQDSRAATETPLAPAPAAPPEAAAPAPPAGDRTTATQTAPAEAELEPDLSGGLVDPLSEA